jgi:hypothetical protein
MVREVTSYFANNVWPAKKRFCFSLPVRPEDPLAKYDDWGQLSLAVEFGYHTFRNINEPGESRPGKFMLLWRQNSGRWQITRVISLHQQ